MLMTLLSLNACVCVCVIRRLIWMERLTSAHAIMLQSIKLSGTTASRFTYVCRTIVLYIFMNLLFYGLYILFNELCFMDFIIDFCFIVWISFIFLFYGLSGLFILLTFCFMDFLFNFFFDGPFGLFN